MGRDAEPRGNHYVFAHRVLPAIAPRLMAELDVHRAELDRLLAFFWDEAAKTVPPEQQVASDGLRGEVREVAGRPAVLVTFPTPQAPTEAYYAAAVAGERVFTLEYGWDVVADAPYTVLGSWRDGAHYNHGAGPEPEPEAFLAAVAPLVR